LQVVINDRTPNANKDRAGWRYKKPGARGATIIRDGAMMAWQDDPEVPGKKIPESITEQLKQIGVTQIEAFVPKYWDMVCEQLCGAQHFTMQNKVIVLEPQEFAVIDARGHARPGAAAIQPEGEPDEDERRVLEGRPADVRSGGAALLRARPPVAEPQSRLSVVRPESESRRCCASFRMKYAK